MNRNRHHPQITVIYCTYAGSIFRFFVSIINLPAFMAVSLKGLVEQEEKKMRHDDDNEDECNGMTHLVNQYRPRTWHHMWHQHDSDNTPHSYYYANNPHSVDCCSRPPYPVLCWYSGRYCHGYGHSYQSYPYHCRAQMIETEEMKMSEVCLKDSTAALEILTLP